MGEEKILVAGHLSLDRIKTPDREEDQVPGGCGFIYIGGCQCIWRDHRAFNHLLQRLPKGSIAAD